MDGQGNVAGCDVAEIDIKGAVFVVAQVLGVSADIFGMVLSLVPCGHAPSAMRRSSSDALSPLDVK
eukprot:scaffold69476_cov32-Tisochrysis_lutea.AAC.1